MRLLTHTVRNYFILSAILLLLSIPAFYFVITKVLNHELEEELREHKADFYQSIPFIKSHDDLKFYQLLNKEFQLNKTIIKIEKDSFYTKHLYDSSEQKIVPYRILRSGIAIKGQAYELIIKESLIGTKDLISAIVMITTGILIILLIGLFAVNRIMTKNLWKPFYKTLHHLKNFEADKPPSSQESNSSITEFNDLDQAVTLLAERTHQAFLMQKEFTENAAHELQTPIAICRAKLELLMQTEALTQEQADLVSTLYEATERITRLNKNLLLLSRIENRQFIVREQIEVHTAVLKSLESHKIQLEEKKITPESIVTPAIIKCNPILLEVLINNLISNAVRYTAHRGRIKIALTANTLTVSNSGEPLNNPEKIFHRFHRESANGYGSGLGLAIVKKICETEGFSIHYRYSSSMHQFTVIF